MKVLFIRWRLVDFRLNLVDDIEGYAKENYGRKIKFISEKSYDVNNQLMGSGLFVNILRLTSLLCAIISTNSLYCSGLTKIAIFALFGSIKKYGNLFGIITLFDL